MTHETAQAVLCSLRSLSRRPGAPKADITHDRIQSMGACLIGTIYHALSTPPVTLPDAKERN